MSTLKQILYQHLKRTQRRRATPAARVLTIIAAVLMSLSVAESGTRGEAHSHRLSVALIAHAMQQGAGRTSSQKSTSMPLDVTFSSDVPETDILLQHEKIGTTGKDGKLLVKIPPGKYQATAIRADYYIQNITIVVDQRHTSFPFFMGRPIPRPAASPTPQPADAKPTPSPSPSPETKPESGGGDGGTTNPGAESRPVDGSAVLERFLNPKTSDQVKQPEWQSLLTSTYQELARDPANLLLKAQAQFAQGQLDYLNGNFASAYDAFNAALRIAPDYDLAMYGLGNVYLATHQPEQAVKSLERAIELNGKLAMAYKVLGDAWLVLKKEKEGRAAYAEAYKLGYTSEGSLNIARNLVKSKRWAEALVALQPLATDSPSAEVYVLLGDSYAGQKKTINAFQAYTKATELDQNSAQAFYKLGEIQFRERNYEAAKEALDRALTLDPAGQMIDRRHGREMLEDAGSQLRKLQRRANKSLISKP